MAAARAHAVINNPRWLRAANFRVQSVPDDGNCFYVSLLTSLQNYHANHPVVAPTNPHLARLLGRLPPPIPTARNIVRNDLVPIRVLIDELRTVVADRFTHAMLLDEFDEWQQYSVRHGGAEAPGFGQALRRIFTKATRRANPVPINPPAGSPEHRQLMTDARRAIATSRGDTIFWASSVAIQIIEQHLQVRTLRLDDAGIVPDTGWDGDTPPPLLYLPMVASGRHYEPLYLHRRGHDPTFAFTMADLPHVLRERLCDAGSTHYPLSPYLEHDCNPPPDPEPAPPPFAAAAAAAAAAPPAAPPADQPPAHDPPLDVDDDDESIAGDDELEAEFHRLPPAANPAAPSDDEEDPVPALSYEDMADDENDDDALGYAPAPVDPAEAIAAAAIDAETAAADHLVAEARVDREAALVAAQAGRINPVTYARELAGQYRLTPRRGGPSNPRFGLARMQRHIVTRPTQPPLYITRDPSIVQTKLTELRRMADPEVAAEPEEPRADEHVAMNPLFEPPGDAPREVRARAAMGRAAAAATDGEESEAEGGGRRPRIGTKPKRCTKRSVRRRGVPATCRTRRSARCRRPPQTRRQTRRRLPQRPRLAVSSRKRRRTSSGRAR